MTLFFFQLHIDAAHQEEVHSPTAQEKEVDFFKEHQDAKLSSGPTAPASEPILTATNGARHVPSKRAFWWEGHEGLDLFDYS